MGGTAACLFGGGGGGAPGYPTSALFRLCKLRPTLRESYSRGQGAGGARLMSTVCARTRAAWAREAVSTHCGIASDRNNFAVEFRKRDSPPSLGTRYCTACACVGEGQGVGGDRHARPQLKGPKGVQCSLEVSSKQELFWTGCMPNLGLAGLRLRHVYVDTFRCRNDDAKLMVRNPNGV